MMKNLLATLFILLLSLLSIPQSQLVDSLIHTSMTTPTILMKPDQIVKKVCLFFFTLKIVPIVKKWSDMY